ncbi:hypothetical protein [Paenibacillus zanthoxyli]|uniref:hypothetical protein n=1 Tax=Paenibacillus zanthoxyli TaxID=369399 RepID=UPI0012EB130B|nr:hypothetical protein [Paenibacillus zanthoxyli]
MIKFSVTISSIALSPSEPPVNSSSTRLPQETPITVTSSFLSPKYVKNYSDDEILSFVLKYSNLNETTVKLKDWPETDENQVQIKDPIFSF